MERVQWITGNYIWTNNLSKLLSASPFATSKSDQKGLRYAPYAFTEQGVAMLLKPRLKQFNQQYPTATMDYTQKMHDRFLIIDNKDFYHIGASLKDLGKQCFAFDKMEDAKTIIPAILTNLS